MPFSIVQVQGGQLALADADGNILGTIDDSGTKLLKIAARLHDGSAFYQGAKETGGNLSTLASKDFAVESGGNLASIKAKTDNIPTDPAKESGKLTTIDSTLTSIKSKTDNIPSDPAKESGKLTTIDSTLTAIKSTDGIKKIVDALPAGDNNIGNVDLASSLPAGTNNIGDVDIASALPAGDNNIGNVDLASSIPAGTNNIGDVDLASAIPAGSNEIGKVAQGTKAANSAAWPLYVVDSSGNVVGVVLDGAVYRLRTETKIVRTSDGAQINPATEDTLALIKNTDGIKKITDPLPTGTNTLGKMDQGTKGAGSNAWPETLYDADGHVVGVVLDGSIYRLQSQAKVVNSSGSYINPATEDTLALIKNTDGIKKITDQLPTGTNEIGKVAQGTRAAASAAWPEYITDASGNVVGVVLDGAVYRLQTQTKIVRASDGAQINPATQETLELIRATDGVKKIVDALPVGDNRVGRVKLTDDTYVQGIEAGGQAKVTNYAVDQNGTFRKLALVQDDTDTSLYRLAVSGKVSVTIPPPPPGGTKFAIAADNPLSISQAMSPHLTSWVIPNGKTMFVQQIIAGCQGDPSADGSKVEVYYYDGSAEHILDRIYVVGQTAFGNYPDTSQARDGTAMTGNGTTKALRIYRSRLSNSTQEIDAVIRGYTI